MTMKVLDHRTNPVGDTDFNPQLHSEKEMRRLVFVRWCVSYYRVTDEFKVVDGQIFNRPDRNHLSSKRPPLPSTMYEDKTPSGYKKECA